VNVDLREFRAAFVSEAEEHLSSIQSLLLEIERGAREGKRAPRQLRELMRLLHTIKGLSAMVGVEPIVTIAHKMETVVRAAERAGAVLDEHTIEVLLAASRSIESRVRSVSQGNMVAAPATDTLAALDALEPPAPASIQPTSLDPTLAEKVSASEQHQLRAGARAGKRAVRVDFAPSSEKAGRGLSITSVRERLAPIAEIVKIVPITAPAGEGAPSGLVFALLLLTDATDEALADAVSGAIDDVTLLFPDEATTASGPAPDAGLDVPGIPASAEREDDFAEGARGVLRVEVGRVDDAIEMLGGLVVTRSRMSHAVERLAASGVDVRELRAVMIDNARQLRDLRSAILRVRMVPMTVVLERLPLVVRGLSRTTGKLARIVMDVGTAELDKTVAEELFPALVHLIRNAVDHGIETPGERVRAGKPETATLRIESHGRDRNVELRISDDGRGVDRAAVAQRAGLAEVPTSDAGLLDLLCRAGLSTRDAADTTSGRGLGMDIVRKIVVQRLGGEMSLETRPGHGTTFVLRVPLTVASIDAFTVRCGGRRYAVPVPIVEEIVEISDAELVHGPRSGLTRASGAPPEVRLLSRRGQSIAVLDLAEVLGVPPEGAPPSANPHALVVRVGHGELVAYAVERVLGRQEIVVRPMADPLVVSPAVAGSTDLGDGRATVVLDLLALHRRAA